MADQLNQSDVSLRNEFPMAWVRRPGARALLLVGVLLLGGLFLASRRRSLPPMVIVGAGAGTYALISYDRNYFYWVDLHGRRGVDTSFLVAYYSLERDPEGMREEARRIAPALWPFADSAHLTKLWLKPTKGLPANELPLLRLSFDVKYIRGTDGAWREVPGWRF